MHLRQHLRSPHVRLPAHRTCLPRLIAPPKSLVHGESLSSTAIDGRVGKRPSIPAITHHTRLLCHQFPTGGTGAQSAQADFVSPAPDFNPGNQGYRSALHKAVKQIKERQCPRDITMLSYGLSPLPGERGWGEGRARQPVPSVHPRLRGVAVQTVQHNDLSAVRRCLAFHIISKGRPPLHHLQQLIQRIHVEILTGSAGFQREQQGVGGVQRGEAGYVVLYRGAADAGAFLFH
jgi:hypothetical protein